MGRQSEKRTDEVVAGAQLPVQGNLSQPCRNSQSFKPDALDLEIRFAAIVFA